MENKFNQVRILYLWHLTRRIWKESNLDTSIENNIDTGITL